MENEKSHEYFIKKAINLSIASIQAGTGGPYGCVVVKKGEIIAEGKNCVTSHNDPSAHAEVEAIRAACKSLNNHQLTDCIIYTSCEPCPMCLGAIYWSRAKAVYFASTREDAANAGFDDSFIYQEINQSPELRNIPFIHIQDSEAGKAFQIWNDKQDKLEY